MVASGHQQYERGDLLALEFSDPDAEAAWICDRIQVMRGLAFQDAATSDPRGLSWSDFAVLFRSVAKDAGPLVAELRKRDIPYVVKGLNRLFDSPEIQAVVGIFRYMNSELDEPALRLLCGDARLASGKQQLVRGRCGAGRGSGLRSGRAVGRLQHPAPLPGVPRGARTARGDGARRPRASASSSSISWASSARRSPTSRQIYFNIGPCAEVQGFRRLADVRRPGAELLRRL